MDSDMEKLLEKKVETLLPTEYGDYKIYVYLAQDGKEHIALVKGELSLPAQNILCRVHSECLTGEVFGSLKCDCKEQLELAFQYVGEAECGVIIYLRQEGRGIGLVEKLKAYQLQHKGLDTVDANIALGHEPDERDYRIAVEILQDLGIESIQMITNNPNKIEQLEQYGIKITKRVPAMPHRVGVHNKGYLTTKQEKMRHIFDIPPHKNHQ